MAKINSRNITDKFIEYFEGDKPFTPSEKRMLGIKLSQLRKNVDQYLKDNNIQTDQEINEIIMDVIEYSKVMGYKYRSIASLGFSVLGESISYWQKRRSIMAIKKEEESYNKHLEKDIKESYNSINHKRAEPDWMNNEKW